MKKRMIISFAVGFSIMLLIASILIVLLYRKYDTVKQEKDMLEKDLTTVCVTKRSIVATEEITADDLVNKRINVNAVPANAYAGTTAFDNNTRKYAKIDIDMNTILLPTMMYSDNVLTDDVRIQEFNMILLPSKLEAEDYIDIRLLLPTGNDYVVCAKKRVKELTAGTIWLELGELDTQYVSSALIESYLTEGSILYAVEYAEPSMQNAAKVTYPVLPAVKQFILQNPNVVDQVQKELSDRLSNYDNDRIILDEKAKDFMPEDMDELVDTLIEKVQEQISKQQQERSNAISAAAAAAAQQQ